jgi:hypothetical protein
MFLVKALWKSASFIFEQVVFVIFSATLPITACMKAGKNPAIIEQRVLQIPFAWKSLH